MTSHFNIMGHIDEGSKAVGTTWPLYSFVTSNPLSGYEGKTFFSAVSEAKKYLDAKVFPEAFVYEKAYKSGEIQEEEINKLLLESGFKNTPDFYLETLKSVVDTRKSDKNNQLNRIMSKWLTAFLDEGLAEWPMPNKSQGFFKAWRQLAKYDSEVAVKSIEQIPESSEEVLTMVLRNYSDDECIEILKQHLTALPGWVGYIKYRIEYNSEWQKFYQITLQDYLAVRLFIANQLNIEVLSGKATFKDQIFVSKLQYIWLKAWENSWQRKWSKDLHVNANYEIPEKPVDAQMVFCIDTRSELIRRHIESKGSYETFGYAGFFGIAMDYESLNDGISRKSCPPILKTSYKVNEIPKNTKDYEFSKYKKSVEQSKFKSYFLKRMKNMLPSTFGYVEGSGLYYGVHLVLRTLFPRHLYEQKKMNTFNFESICEPQIKKLDSTIPLNSVSIAEKAAIVKSAFDLMGWKTFAPLVLFIGHGSHSKNNPFGSSLDCGACAASPGRHNARMLARLANLKAVRDALGKDYNILIPEDTFFVGGEHNTTTDEIVLFDSEVPTTHEKALKNVKRDLYKAQVSATQERFNMDVNSVNIAYKKANSWSETRPEWGLAGNAGFVIGPRSLTKNLNLERRCFLHSYDWKQDNDAASLEAIMQGPMVVTQWINNHYYFSSVDNETFGSSTKITHNVVGKFGVLEGNGGDLKMGLPFESLNISDSKIYHQPLRLSVFIQAPLNTVKDILLKNTNLKSLVDNEWIYLIVLDPTQNNMALKYEKNGEWVFFSKKQKNLSHKKEYIERKILQEV